MDASARKSRRRGLGAFVVAGLVVLGLVAAFFVVDGGLRSYAEEQIEREIASNLPDTVTGDVALPQPLEAEATFANRQAMDRAYQEASIAFYRGAKTAKEDEAANGGLTRKQKERLLAIARETLDTFVRTGRRRSPSSTTTACRSGSPTS